jgi:predicted nucleic acid-binding protein
LIFVDTSFWVALALKPDRRHQEAAGLFAARADSRLVTSNLVVGEVWTFLRSRFGHPTAVSVLNRLESTSRLQLLRIDEDAERDAWAWLRRHDERTYSFVDATSFAVMRRLAIREAFAFDADFAAAGFVELRA